MSKYHNKKIMIDGILFDSHFEGQRYEELKLLQHVGKISGLEIQKKFEIIPKTKTERAASYMADFCYIENGQQVIEDTKCFATKTKDYILKRKLVKWRYPDIEFREIEKEYNRSSRRYSFNIKNKK